LLFDMFSACHVTLVGGCSVFRITSARCPRKVRAYLPSRRRLHRKISHPYQVVGGYGEGKDPADPALASMASLPQEGNGFEPPKDLLDPFADALTDLVARVARRTPVNGRAFIFPGNVRCGIETTQLAHEPSVVIGFVTRYRDAMGTEYLLNHADGCLPFGRPGSHGKAGTNSEAVSVLHEHVTHEGELRLFPLALPVQASLGIGG